MTAPIEYTIDKHNRIVALSDSWHTFYSQNGGTRESDSFIGENLFQNIVGKDVQMLYGTLLRHVRSTQRMIKFPFCCNSGNIRRNLFMSIAPGPDERLVFSNVVQDVMPFTRPPSREKRLRHEPLTLCSWCNKIKADCWLDPQEAILKFGLFEALETEQFVHGICPRCQSRVLSVLIQAQAEKAAAAAASSSALKCA